MKAREKKKADDLENHRGLLHKHYVRKYTVKEAAKEELVPEVRRVAQETLKTEPDQMERMDSTTLSRHALLPDISRELLDSMDRTIDTQFNLSADVTRYSK